jgi:hypothetical protein
MPRPKNSVLRARAAISKRWSGTAPANEDTAAREDSGQSPTSSDNDIYVFDSEIDLNDDALNVAKYVVLKWKAGAKPKRPAVYQKNSRTTKWRKSKMIAERTASVSNCRRITDILPKTEELDNSPDDSLSEEDDIVVPPSCSISEALAAVSRCCSVSVNQNNERRLKSLTKYDYIRYLSLSRFFQLVKRGKPKIEASLEAASLFPAKSPGYQARSIRKWAQHFLETRSLPVHRQGRHIKTKSLNYDEDVARECRRYLKSQVNISITSHSFADWIKNHLHLKVDLPIPVSVSENRN